MLKQMCLVSLLAATGPVFADSDPSVSQVYDEARSGHVTRAIEMMGQVLQEHPRSAKAHYVMAELYAEQGKLSLAREELDEAQRLSPGLSFASARSVEALERTLARPAILRRASNDGPGFRVWEAVIGFAAAGGILWMFMRRRPASGTTFASTVPVPATPVPGDVSPLTGAYPVGARAPIPAAAPGATMSASSSAPITPPAAPSFSGASASGNTSASAGSAGSGIGSAIAGGLAAGASVVAGQEIARHLFGPESQPVQEVEVPQVASHDPNLGGDDFGLSDTSSWDDNAGLDDDDDDDDSWS